MGSAQILYTTDRSIHMHKTSLVYSDTCHLGLPQEGGYSKSLPLLLFMCLILAHFRPLILIDTSTILPLYRESSSSTHSIHPTLLYLSYHFCVTHSLLVTKPCKCCMSHHYHSTTHSFLTGHTKHMHNSPQS